MGFKNFLVKYFLSIVLTVVAAFAAARFEARWHSVGESAEKIINSSGEQPPMKQNPAVEKTSGAIDPGPLVVDTAEEEAVIYMPEEYTLSHSESGLLENIDGDNGVITVVDGDKKHSAIVTAATKVFRNAERVSLSDVKDADRVTIMGRKKTAEGEDFIADSVYASISAGVSAPVAPAPAAQ